MFRKYNIHFSKFMAKFKFTPHTVELCEFYDENQEYFYSSVEAFFEPRTDEEIKKEVMGEPDNICIPILERESELQFECEFKGGCWVLDFISSIAS